jgi:hypothetical protein
MADWSTIASLSTAAGTLVLAVATFSSVRSSQRSARIAEQALSLNLRPVLHPSRYTDPAEKVRFGEGRFVRVDGGTAAVEREGDSIYLVIPLRNIGSGLAVLHGWRLERRAQEFDPGNRTPMQRPDVGEFHRLSRDLYVAAGDVGFWQGAIRLPDDPFRGDAEAALDGGDAILVDVLYGDEMGGQRMITRFVLSQREDGGRWLPGVVRHWSLDGRGPRE